MSQIEKRTTTELSPSGHKLFLLGIKDGIYYWLHEPTWDCGWYWGLGYVETYTNTKYPENAMDIESHQHLRTMFLNKNANIVYELKSFFDDIVLSEKEMYQFAELIKSMYICRDFADMTNRGGANYTTNPCKNILQDDKLNNHVNNTMLPAIFKQIELLLTPN